MTRLGKATNGTCPSICVSHGSGAYRNAQRALQSLDGAAIAGKRVLLKPNAGRVATCGAGITTHPDVVAAAIDAFREMGADVVIGESPIAGVRMREAFEATGIAAVARQRHCTLLDMDRRPFVELPVPDGLAIRSLKVCPDVLESDLIVSMPVMKMHMHTGVTLAVKNMKGCLWRRSKVELHMLPPVAGCEEKPLDIALADMSSVLRPDMAVIDGTMGMEGLGPSAGTAKPLDIVLVGTDAFAADAVACQLMGTCATQIPHLRLGAERGYGVIDLARIAVTPENWRDWIAPFAAPPKNLSIEFPRITVLDNGSCSACQSTLLLFLRKNHASLFDYFPDQDTLNIAIGKGHSQLPERTLCIGNCTADLCRDGILVSGCPPVGSQILNAISSQPAAGGTRHGGTAAP